MKRLQDIITVLVIALTLTACGDDSCYDNGSSLPLAQFYLDGAQSTLNGITVMGIGVPGDSLLADSSSLKEIYLPLRATVKTTSYRVTRWVAFDDVKEQFNDTLTFEYEPIEYFSSAECGAMYNFAVKRVNCTDHAIDSVKLLTPLITNAVTPALRIYFTDF